MTQTAPLAPMQAPDDYRTLRFALRQGKALRLGAGIAVAGIIGWIGTRTALPELWVLGIAAGVALNFVLKVALEVLALVADTLLPQ